MELGATSRPGNRPRMFMCYLCGREYGTKSLPIHIPQCQKKWLLEEENKPKNHRRPLPRQPNLEKAISNGGTQAFDTFNSEALEAFEQTLQQCHHCQRRFLPKPYLHHQKGCTAVNPAKPAGTGLIPISLTNRLVPGAIAGSMHGNSRTQHVPLRLCKPAEKPGLANSLKMSRAVSARPVWTGADGDDPPLFEGQSSSWNNNLCNETENCRKLTNPRPFSVYKGNGYDDKSQLADTFENLWHAHSRADNLRLPRRRSGGAQEWCSQGETNTSLSLRRDANPRPKSALSSQNRRPLSATCHDSQGHLLRDSRQAGCNENCTLPESKCTREISERRRHL